MSHLFAFARQVLRLFTLYLQHRTSRAALRRATADEREAMVRRLLNERGIFPD